ncbi:UNVERIFIED_CONTAM: hypothetical protein RMT77_015045 [Armadillidium vulgare]
MDVEIHKWCNELGLKGKEATEFIKLHKFDIDVYEYIQLCKEMEMENDDIIELFLIGAEIRRNRCRVYYDRLLEVSEREAAAEKFERKCKLLENEFISKVEETPNPIIEVISTKKSSTPESVSLENIVIEIEKPITSSQVLPMKGENCFSQPQSSAEREEPSSQDLPILSTSPKWESNEDEISSLSKAFAEQDEKEENLVTSDVIKRTENVLFSKELSNRSSISHKVYIEKNKEKKIERSRTPTPEWGKVDIREDKKKDAYKSRKRKRSKSRSAERDKRSRRDKKQERDKSSSSSSRHKKDREKDKENRALQEKRKEDERRRSRERRERDKREERERREKYERDERRRKEWARRMEERKEREKLREDRIRDRRRDDRSPKARDRDASRNHDLEKMEEDSLEDPNIVVIPELTFQNEDAKVESESRLPFSKLSSPSLCFSLSFSISIEENVIKKEKEILRKKKSEKWRW